MKQEDFKSKCNLSDYKLVRSAGGNVGVHKTDKYTWRDGSKTVAEVCLTDYGDSKHISNLEVFKPYKGSGLGRQVVRFAIDNGGKTLWCHKDNNIAMNLYESVGFVKEGTIEDDEYYMELSNQHIAEAVSVLDSFLQEASHEKFYRFTYDGVGIYQAFKMNVGPVTWVKFLKNKDINGWLPKPKDYLNGYESYFTEYGYAMFVTKVLPEMSKYLDPKKIETEEYDDLPARIIYRDSYQVIVNRTNIYEAQITKQSQDVQVDPQQNPAQKPTKDPQRSDRRPVTNGDLSITKFDESDDDLED